METENKLFESVKLPDWLILPNEYKILIDENLELLPPWFLLRGEMLREKYEGLKDRYPSRKVFPFARRADNDDVACWEKNSYPQVTIIHDYANYGYEGGLSTLKFEDWLKYTIDCYIEYTY